MVVQLTGTAFNTVDNSKGTGDADQYPPLPFGDSISDEAFDALEELAGYPNYIRSNWILSSIMPIMVFITRLKVLVPCAYFPRASNPYTVAARR